MKSNTDIVQAIKNRIFTLESINEMMVYLETSNQIPHAYLEHEAAIKELKSLLNYIENET